MLNLSYNLFFKLYTYSELNFEENFAMLKTISIIHANVFLKLLCGENSHNIPVKMCS